MSNTTQELRFAFGKNWESFAKEIDEEKVLQAKKRLQSLLAPLSVENKTFLDIGCGSGLHSLAALDLGAAAVTAFDLDSDSVATTRHLLEQRAPNKKFTVQLANVLALNPNQYPKYEIVYSWGVLHHTGSMQQAIIKSCQLVAPGGSLVIALYGKTKFCFIWKRIKHWYVATNGANKIRAEMIYIKLFGWYLALRGQSLANHIANYKNKRGMDFHHDVRDWIGGYPYESIHPKELDKLLSKQGMILKKSHIKRRSGLFGSGCDEYVYLKYS